MPPSESEVLKLFEAALDVASDTRRDWLEAQTEGQPELRGRVLSLLNADGSLSSALRTGGASDTMAPLVAPERVGAYKITGLIGEGGMGAVFKAERDTGDFTHDVAIKIIRPGVFSEALEARFKHERQVLARLNHANIARLFDGGELGDGSPYLIMEYVDGEPILGFAETRKLDLKARIALFRDVCLAVRHAHQNLIIHRDITPSNVLVTHEGVAKLIDFGISRPQEDEGLSAKQGVSLSFTPGYAAPERTQGQASSTLTDIYSLGRLLADLINGQPEDADLRAIARRAAAHEAENRYASVDAIIEDLDAWADQRPVSARDGDMGYRFGKYLKRRKGIVAGLTAGFLALAAAFGVTLVQYHRAETARAEANQRFEEVRTLATTMMTDIYQAVERVPGTTIARQRIAEAAQSYLDRLAETPNADADLKFDTARGYTSLGLIYASPKGASLEMTDEGKAAYARATELYQQALDARPDDPEILREFGKHYYYMAEVAINPDNDTERANDLLDKSEALLNRLVELYPDDMYGQVARIYTQAQRGDIYMLDYRVDDAIALYEALVPEVDALIAKQAESGDPPNEDLIRLGNSSRRVLGQAYTYANRYEDAIRVLDEAIETYPQIEALNPDDTFTIRGKAMAYGRRAYALRWAGEFERSVADYKTAIAISEERVARDAADIDAERMLVVYKGELAGALDGLGRYDEAEALLMDAMPWHEAQAAKAPTSLTSQRNLWIQYYIVATHYATAGDEDKACDYYTRMLNYTSKLKTLDMISEGDQQAVKDTAAEFPFCQ